MTYSNENVHYTVDELANAWYRLGYDIKGLDISKLTGVLQEIKDKRCKNCLESAKVSMCCSRCGVRLDHEQPYEDTLYFTVKPCYVCLDDKAEDMYSQGYDAGFTEGFTEGLKGN